MTKLAVVSPGSPDPSFPQPAIVVVDEGLMRPTRFSLSYEVSIRDSDIDLLTNDALGPDADVLIQVAPDSHTQTLVKGVVLKQNMQLKVGGDGSTLEVLGADQSALMNREFQTKLWSDVTDDAIVQQVFAQYGFIPQADSTSTVHAEAKNSLAQRETDLQLVYRLARRNGFLFWLDTDGTGATTNANFKKPPVQGDASITFSIRAGQSNVEAISISWDSDRPSGITSKQLDLTNLSIQDASPTASPLDSLAKNAFSDVIKTPRNTHMAVPVSDQADLQSRAEAVLIESGWFVSARVSAKLSVIKNLVRPHSIVALDGVGSRHSGNYFVARVVHSIDDVDHLMTIDLIRNSWN